MAETKELPKVYRVDMESADVVFLIMLLGIEDAKNHGQLGKALHGTLQMDRVRTKNPEIFAKVSAQLEKFFDQEAFDSELARLLGAYKCTDCGGFHLKEEAHE